MKTRIIFVRHGESVDNVRKITQGQSDCSLSKKGIEEAKSVGVRLKKEKIDIIFVSDLKRAKDTAKEITRYHVGIPIFYDKRLRERNFGVYQGRFWTAVRDAAKRSGKDIDRFKPRGGESLYDVIARSKLFFDEILPKYRGRNILIIAHGGFIMASLLSFLNDNITNRHKYSHNNTGVTMVEFNNNTFKLRKLNCTKHLK